jgi:general secretion pathway protein N
MNKSLDSKTLLLGALFIWALALLIASGFGFGGRFSTMPLDAAVAKPIPDVKVSANTTTMGPLNQYQSISSRPLLNFDRRPSPVAAAPGSNSAAELDVMLTSVLRTPNFEMAILRENQGGASRRVRLGEMVEGTNWRLSQLEPRRAILDGPSGQKTLDLRVFDGKGGEPVTVIAANPDNVQANPAPQGPNFAPPPPVSVKPAVVAASAEPNNGQTMTQEQQIEAIRQRIAARRAQMQADAARAAADEKK